jgi:DNA uptake protein ComE-like DNA-binding protein
LPVASDSTSATASAAADASAAEATSAATGTVNANTASVDELQAAFAAAGVSNAGRWARDVADYRPYESDPTWARLRQELGKYNIDPTVIEQILGVLTV